MDEKLSDQAAKFVDETFESLHELDLHEQNEAISVLCIKVIVQRKNQLERMSEEKGAYEEKICDLINRLHGFAK